MKINPDELQFSKDEVLKISASLKESDPALALKLRSIVEPEQTVEELRVALDNEKLKSCRLEQEVEMFKRRLDAANRDRNDLRMSLVVLGTNRRTNPPNGIVDEFQEWYEAFVKDHGKVRLEDYEDVVDYVNTKCGWRDQLWVRDKEESAGREALEVGYIAGRVAHQLYEQDSIALTVHKVCMQLKKSWSWNKLWARKV